MHEVQEAVKNIDSMDDDEIINAIVVAWSAVCEENESHKDIVSKRDFEQWAGYRDETVAELKRIVAEYTGELSEKDRKFFEDLASNITRATHKSSAEIIAETAKEKTQRDIETVKNPVFDEIEKKKNVWAKILGKFSR